MATVTRGTSSNYLQRGPSPSGLADVLDIILDKGLVIDAYVRVSVQAIEHGDLAAFVSLIPGDKLRVRRRDLVNHLRVIEEAFESGTIVPCAFGTLLPSQEAVRRDVLGTRRDELVAALSRLEGFVQLNVRVLYDEDALLREVVANEAQIARLREETRRLGDAGYYERS